MHPIHSTQLVSLRHQDLRARAASHHAPSATASHPTGVLRTHAGRVAAWLRPRSHRRPLVEAASPAIADRAPVVAVRGRRAGPAPRPASAEREPVAAGR